MSITNFEGIPPTLQHIPHWLLYKIEVAIDKNGKERYAKIPYQINGQKARPNDTTTCATFNRCKLVYEQGGYHGIGYLFTEDDPYVCVDWDDCVNDGIVDPDVMQELLSLCSYGEISQSGKGVHCFMVGIKPGDRCRWKVEMYSKLRFVAITGYHIEETPKDICQAPQEAISKIYNEKVVNPASTKNADGQCKPISSPNAADNQIIQSCMKAGNRAKFKALFDGDISKYRSASEADLALCNIVAFYTQDEDQINRIMQMSGLYRKEWKHKGSRTIRRAISGLNRTYQGTTKQHPHGVV